MGNCDITTGMNDDSDEIEQLKRENAELRQALNEALAFEAAPGSLIRSKSKL